MPKENMLVLPISTHEPNETLLPRVNGHDSSEIVILCRAKWTAGSGDESSSIQVYFRASNECHGQIVDCRLVQCVVGSKLKYKVNCWK